MDESGYDWIAHLLKKCVAAPQHRLRRHPFEKTTSQWRVKILNGTHCLSHTLTEGLSPVSKLLTDGELICCDNSFYFRNFLSDYEI